MPKPFLLVAAFQVILLACVLSAAALPQAEIRNEPAAISFEDVTAHAGITFEHAVSPDKKYLYESMSGGVLLIDYDGDGWLDIYFTNAQSVAMTLSGQRAKSALYRNNHDGTFTDVTDKAGVGYPCSAMGGAVGDYNNDGWPDMVITCQEGVVLLRNNANGTFTDVSKQAHLTDPRWSTGAAFGTWHPGEGSGEIGTLRVVRGELALDSLVVDGAHHRAPATVLTPGTPWTVRPAARS